MRLRVLIVALIAVGVLIPTVLVLTQQRAAGANMMLSILDGRADVARRAGNFARVADGHVLIVGDRVRTADQSHAVVTFFDGSTVEVEPATTITLVEATAAPSGAITIQLEQALGRTWSSVQELTHANSKFEIKTPSTTATVRGTGFVTDVQASGATTVTTTDGIVEVSAQGLTIVVPAGSLTSVQPGSQPSPPLPGPPAQNTLRFGLHSPAYLLVVDPFGRTCGIVPAGPTVIRQIPGCLATDPGIDPQLVDLPNAMTGTYSIVIDSIAPGGDFVATASAVDGAGNLSFNHFLGGGGPPETKFGTSLKVESGPNGVLASNGLAKLSLVDRAPTHVVVLSTSPRPTLTGTPNPSLFALLPRFGFTAGIEVTSPSATQTSAPPTPSVTPTPSPTPTEVVTAEPTRAPTVAPVRTIAPPPPPTATPAPTPTPSPPPTASPSPTPAPTPSGPTLIGGVVSAGSPMTITGHGWSTPLITLSWEDGRPMVQVNADASGDFVVAVIVPINTSVGTYRISASDGLLTASGQFAVYAPTLAVSCTSTTAAVSLVGGGWPPFARYAVRSSLLATPLSGTVGADGTFNASFMPPSGALPGDYQFSASAGSLLLEPQSCTLR
ncbi:MAG: FecR family protein [Candidatus Limnocylindria bacterium]